MATMTKAQLVDENIRLRAQCDALEGSLRVATNDLTDAQNALAVLHQKHTATLLALREAFEREERAAQAEEAQLPRVQGKPMACQFDDYWSYVAACRKATPRGQVVKYLSRDQWGAAG